MPDETGGTGVRDAVSFFQSRGEVIGVEDGTRRRCPQSFGSEETNVGVRDTANRR